jgi:hypothetical protein
VSEYKFEARGLGLGFGLLVVVVMVIREDQQKGVTGMICRQILGSSSDFCIIRECLILSSF